MIHNGTEGFHSHGGIQFFSMVERENPTKTDDDALFGTSPYDWGLIKIRPMFLKFSAWFGGFLNFKGHCIAIGPVTHKMPMV